MSVCSEFSHALVTMLLCWVVSGHCLKWILTSSVSWMLYPAGRKSRQGGYLTQCCGLNVFAPSKFAPEVRREEVGPSGGDRVTRVVPSWMGVGFLWRRLQGSQPLPPYGDTRRSRPLRRESVYLATATPHHGRPGPRAVSENRLQLTGTGLWSLVTAAWMD